MFYYGISLYEQSEYEDAIEIFDKSLSKYPKFSDALYYKAIALSRLGAYEKAKEIYTLAKKQGEAVYEVGCLGKISDYQKSKDGRILINLTGVSRFKILKEVSSKKIYREFQVDYQIFEKDIENFHNDVDTSSLMEKAKTFFKRYGLLLNWREFEKLDTVQKINTLAMIAPVTNEEKQKLLEAVTIKNKIDTLESIISFYLHETGLNNQTIQ